MGAATSVDQLQIDIQTQSTKANDALDRLVLKLDKLSASLGKIDGSKITGLANGVSKLGSAMRGMNNIKTADFTRLASNLQKLGNINVSALNSSASSISLLSKSFNGLGTVSQNAQQVGEMSKNIAKLGNKNVQQAIANMPNLATAMKNFMQTLSTAPNVNQNIIQMTNALAKLTAQGSKVGTLSNSLFGGLNRTDSAMTRATKKTFSLSSAIGRFYQTYYLAIRGIKKLWESIEGTADYIEAYNYYNVAFGKIASEWKQDFKKFGYENAETYAESFTNRMNSTLGKLSGVQINTETGMLSDTGMKNLGLNIKEITQYASQLASVTNSVGQTGEVSLAAASSFTKLAGDISSLFNLDYSTVATNLQSGLIGQSRALYKYGIDITNATLQTYAYKLGLSKAVSEMTQAEKMQLRMIAILDQSRVSWGDQANTLNSVSNMVRQLKNNASELGTVFGQLFVPVLQKVLSVINGVSIALKRLVTDIAGFLGIEIDLSSFGQGYTDIEDGLGDIEDGLNGVTNAANKATKGLQGFDELSNLTSSASSSGVSGAGGDIDLTDEIIKATEEYEKVWAEAYDKMESKAQKFADKISQYLEPLKKLFKDIAIGDWFAVGEDTSNLVSGIFDFFSKAIESVDWYGLGTNIGNFLAGLNWTQILSSVGRFVWNAINAAIELWKGSFDAAPIETTIITAIALLSWSGLGSALWKGVKRSIVVSFGGEEGMGFAALLATLIKKAILYTPQLFTSNAFTYLASDFLLKLENQFYSMLPNGISKVLKNILGGMAVGALAGSWIPGVGTLAGAIVGALVGALEGIEINGESLFNQMFGPFFNFDYTKSVFKLAGESFSKVKKAFEEKDWLSVGGNIVKGIGLGIWGALSFLVEPISDLFEETVEWICKAFGINSPAKEMEPYGEYIILGIIQGFTNKFEKMKEKIREFFNNVVAPMFSKEEWSNKISNIKDALADKWNTAKQWWNDNVKLPKLNIDFGFSTESIKKSINKVINWINTYIIGSLNKISIKIPKIEAFGKTLFEGNTIGFNIRPISTFETGGFPKSADLFWANENGIPELVGTMGGKTAVASGMEITGIKDAIYSTGQKETDLMQTMVGLLKIIAEKEFGITDSEIGKSAQRYAKEYFNRTGNEAYIF